MGGLNLDRDYSRSGSGTPPVGLGGMGGGGGPGSFTVEQLLQCGEALAAGIVTSFDMKKKDAQGRTYLNCFFGKEALNWSVAGLVCVLVTFVCVSVASLTQPFPCVPCTLPCPISGVLLHAAFVNGCPSRPTRPRRARRSCSRC